jgi:hypothetical protein
MPKSTKASRAMKKNKAPVADVTKLREARVQLAGIKKGLVKEKSRNTNQVQGLQNRLKEVDFLEGRANVIVNKYYFDMNTSKNNKTAYVGDYNLYLEGIMAKVVVSQRSEIPTLINGFKSTGPYSTPWECDRHTHRFNFVLTEKLPEHLKFDLKVTLHTTGNGWQHEELRMIMRETERDGGPEFDSTYWTYVSYFSPTKIEIEENDGNETFRVSVRAAMSSTE